MEMVYRSTREEMMSDPEMRKLLDWEGKKLAVSCFIWTIINACARFFEICLRKVGVFYPYPLMEKYDYLYVGEKDGKKYYDIANTETGAQTVYNHKGEMIKRVAGWDAEEEIFEPRETKGTAGGRVKNYDTKNSVSWGKIRGKKKEAVAV